MHPRLLLCIEHSLGGHLRLEHVREPQALRLRGRVHVLIRDAADVDRAQVLRDVAECPLFREIRRRPDRARPHDTIHVVRLRVVEQSVPSRVERGDFLSLKELERVDARRAVPVCAQRVDVAEERRIDCAVLKLFGAI